MKKFQKHRLTFLLSSIFLIFCGKEAENVLIEKRFSDRPVHENSNLIRLEKIHSIPLLSDKYEISMIANMDVDEHDNLYTMNSNDFNITVFDRNGEYVRTMGNKGQGPKELIDTRGLKILDSNIYIIERFKGIKIWDLQGEYIDKMIMPSSNYEAIIPEGDGFFVLDYIFNREHPMHRDYNFSRYDDSLKEKNVLLNYTLDLHREPFWEPKFVMSIDEEGNFYFPENGVTYNVIKYDKEGAPLFSFGRAYERVAFSSQARALYEEKFGKYIKTGQAEAMTEFPPIVRKTLIDSRANIWSVVGEISEFWNPEVIESTVDIFSKEGEWLYTFSMADMAMESIIKNDRLYTITKVDKPTAQQYINVYQIHYDGAK